MKTPTVLTLSRGLHFPLGPSLADLTPRKRPGPGVLRNQLLESCLSLTILTFKRGQVLQFITPKALRLGLQAPYL